MLLCHTCLVRAVYQSEAYCLKSGSQCILPQAGLADTQLNKQATLCYLQMGMLTGKTGYGACRPDQLVSCPRDWSESAEGLQSCSIMKDHCCGVSYSADLLIWSQVNTFVVLHRRFIVLSTAWAQPTTPMFVHLCGAQGH